MGEEPKPLSDPSGTPAADSGVATPLSPTTAPPFAPGQVLGNRYRVEALLGRGGMGEVFRAFDVKLQVEVALKRLRPGLFGSERALEALRQEVRAARQVVSPHVCRVFDLVEIEGQELVSMEHVDGRTLLEHLREKGPLGLREAAEIASQFLSGLEAIHRAGFVHRDVKPENLMLTRAGRVVVMDFGIAKPALMESGTVSGTPAYMAPEQARGERLDARADVFSAGVVLAEMIAAEGVRDHKSRETVWKGVHSEPPKLPDTPWVPVLRKAVARAAAERYASAAALARALEEVTLRVEGAEELRPYPGLSSFTEAEAEYFFGRELEVEAMWRRLERPHLLGLIGPSGAGKSSFLRAGLLPAKPPSWRVVLSTPGSRPFMAMAQALVPEFTGDTEATQWLLRFEEADVGVSLFQRWRTKHERALLIVDQFEELFTLNPPEIQARFAELLGRLAVEADVHVLLSMRDDFLFQCVRQPALKPIFSELTPLPPLSAEGLRRALVQPALKCGYRFEDEALVEEMLAEVENERGALPLVAFAAARLWEKRDRENGLVTRKAYREIGGVAGALAQHAEATLERIVSERQGIVREVFRNLVTSHGTRAVAEREELLSAFPERKAAENVLAALIDARLLTSFEVEGAEGQPSQHRIEIVHESLLTAWPRLVRWQAQDEEGALLRDQLKQAAHLWDEKGRSEDLLWTGTGYREYTLWRERYPGALTALEEDFAQAMADKARRRKRRVTAAVASVIVALTGIAIAIGISRHQAVQARQRAEMQARRAEASKLLALAELRLTEDPTEALAFAIASLEQIDTREARVFALKAVWKAPPAFELIATANLRVPAFSPDGGLLAVAGHSPEARVWREDGSGPIVLPGHAPTTQGPLRPLWVSPDRLVIGLCCGLARRGHVWSMPAGKAEATLEFGDQSFWGVAANRVFTETPAGGSREAPEEVRLRSWALDGGASAELGRVAWRALGVQDGTFAPDGQSWLYAKGARLFARKLPITPGAADRVLGDHHPAIAALWKGLYQPNTFFTENPAGETRQWTLGDHEGPRTEVVPRPTTASRPPRPDASGWLVDCASTDARAQVWRRGAWLAARPLELRRSGSWWGAACAIHPFGDWLVASTAMAAHLTFWPLATSCPSVVDGYSSLTRPVAFSPDGRWLASSWSDGRLRLWPLAGAGPSTARVLDAPPHLDWKALAIDPASRLLLVVGNYGEALVAPLDGARARQLPGLGEDMVLGAAAFSPSGRYAASAFYFGRGQKSLRVWDVETGASRTFDLPQPAGPAGGGSRTSGWEGIIMNIAFAEESTLYTGGHGGARRWDLATGRQELVIEVPPDQTIRLQIRPEKNLALTRQYPVTDVPIDCQPLVQHDLATHASRALPAFGTCVNFFDLDPSAEVAVSGDFDGIVRVGRLSGGEPHLLIGHKGVVNQVAISPDLKWIASTGEDNTLRLWPMPDLSKPPLHAWPRDRLLAKLRSLTNLRVVPDPSASAGWKLEVGPFPGWKDVPAW